MISHQKTLGFLKVCSNDCRPLNLWSTATIYFCMLFICWFPIHKPPPAPCSFFLFFRDIERKNLLRFAPLFLSVNSLKLMCLLPCLFCVCYFIVANILHHICTLNSPTDTVQPGWDFSRLAEIAISRQLISAKKCSATCWRKVGMDSWIKGYQPFDAFCTTKRPVLFLALRVQSSFEHFLGQRLARPSPMSHRFWKASIALPMVSFEISWAMSLSPFLVIWSFLFSIKEGKWMQMAQPLFYDILW